MDVSGDCLLLDVYKNGITLTNKTISYVLKIWARAIVLQKCSWKIHICFPPLVMTECWAVFHLFSLIIIYAIVRVLMHTNSPVFNDSLSLNNWWGMCLATNIVGTTSMYSRWTSTVCYATALRPNISGFHAFQTRRRRTRWASQWDSMRGKAMTSYRWTCQMFPDATECFPTYE